MLHAACDGPVICMDAERLNPVKNDRSGSGNGLELSERREKHNFFPSKRNKEQTRHVLVRTINFDLMLVATRNLVELVRSRGRLSGVFFIIQVDLALTKPLKSFLYDDCGFKRMQQKGTRRRVALPSTPLDAAQWTG